MIVLDPAGDCQHLAGPFGDRDASRGFGRTPTDLPRQALLCTCWDSLSPMGDLDLNIQGEGVYFASRQYQAIKKLAAKTRGSLSVEQQDGGSVLVTTPDGQEFLYLSDGSVESR